MAGAQLPTDAEVKAFAAKHGPKNLVVLTTTDTLERPGWWAQSKPTWNFKGSSLALISSTMPLHTLTIAHSYTLTITCTCCHDEIEGTQDQDIFSCSFSDSSWLPPFDCTDCSAESVDLPACISSADVHTIFMVVVPSLPTQSPLSPFECLD